MAEEKEELEVRHDAETASRVCSILSASVYGRECVTNKCLPAAKRTGICIRTHNAAEEPPLPAPFVLPRDFLSPLLLLLVLSLLPSCESFALRSEGRLRRNSGLKRCVFVVISTAEEERGEDNAYVIMQISKCTS